MEDIPPHPHPQSTRTHTHNTHNTHTNKAYLLLLPAATVTLVQGSVFQPISNLIWTWIRKYMTGFIWVMVIHPGHEYSYGLNKLPLEISFK